MILDELIGKFEDMAVNSGMLASFDLFELTQNFFTKESELVIKANTDRLYEKSLNRDGLTMPLYSAETARHKRNLGLPSHRYTYYETGETYESLELIAEEEYAMIVLGVDAPDYSMYLDGKAWGLTEEDYDMKVRGSLLDFIQNELKKYLLNG